MRLLRRSSDGHGRGRRGDRARSEDAFRNTFRRAADAAQSGDVDTAEDVLRAAVATGDDLGAPGAAFALAQLLEGAGRPTDADRAYAEAAALSDPETTPEVHCNLAARWAALGRSEDAIGAYSEIVSQVGPRAGPEAREHAAVAAFRLGELLAERGDTRAAEQAWRQAMEEGDEQTATHARLALARHLHESGAQSDFVDSLLYYVIERDHVDCSPQAALLLADRLVAHDQDEKALEMYDLVAETELPPFASEATTQTDKLLEVLRDARDRARDRVTSQRENGNARSRTITRELKENIGTTLDEIAREYGRPVGSPDHQEYDPDPELAEIERREE